MQSKDCKIQKPFYLTQTPEERGYWIHMTSKWKICQMGKTDQPRIRSSHLHWVQAANLVNKSCTWGGAELCASPHPPPITHLFFLNFLTFSNSGYGCLYRSTVVSSSNMDAVTWCVCLYPPTLCASVWVWGSSHVSSFRGLCCWGCSEGNTATTKQIWEVNVQILNIRELWDHSRR